MQVTYTLKCEYNRRRNEIKTSFTLRAAIFLGSPSIVMSWCQDENTYLH